MDATARRRTMAARALAGGTDGNEVLTGATGALLFVLLAALGVTIVRIGQLTWLHLFLGLLLIGPVVLKLASTGYRFTRYYTRDAAYVAAGPPWLPLRLMAPVLVASTVAVFATGVVLLAVGAGSRDPWLLLHKISFIAWIVFAALHVAGHLPEMGRLLGVRHELISLPGIRTDLDRGGAPRDLSTGIAGGPGTRARWAALITAVIAGVILAIALVPQFGAWTGIHAHFHHG